MELVGHIGPPIVVREGGPLFVPATWLAYTQNNHTESVFIKTLLGPSALVSYWLILTSEFNPFLLICVSPHASGLLGKIQHV